MVSSSNKQPSLIMVIRCNIQKQPLEIFCEKRCSLKFHKIQSLFFNKVAGLRPATLLKKRLWYRSFPVNFVKVLRTPSLQNTSGRLLLNVNYVISLKRCKNDFVKKSTKNEEWHRHCLKLSKGLVVQVLSLSNI